MTKQEFNDNKKKITKKIMEQLNIPMVKGNELYYKNHSKYNSVNKQIMSFYKKLKGDNYFKIWFPLEYLTENDIIKLAEVFISRSSESGEDRQLLEQLSKNKLDTNYRFFMYYIADVYGKVFAEDEMLRDEKNKKYINFENKYITVSDYLGYILKIIDNYSKTIYVTGNQINIEFFIKIIENINDEIKNVLIQSREKINLYVYKPDLSWIEMYINIVEHIITYLLLYILPYSIKNNFTQQKKIVDEEIYEYILCDKLANRGFRTEQDIYSYIVSKSNCIKQQLEQKLNCLEYVKENFLDYSVFRAYSYCKRNAAYDDKNEIMVNLLKEINNKEESFNVKLAAQKRLEKIGEYDKEKMRRICEYNDMLQFDPTTYIFKGIPNMEKIIYREVYVFDSVLSSFLRHNAAKIIKTYTTSNQYGLGLNGYFVISEIDDIEESIKILCKSDSSYIDQAIEWEQSTLNNLFHIVELLEKSKNGWTDTTVEIKKYLKEKVDPCILNDVMVELGLKEKYQSNNLLDDAVKHLFSSDCTLEDSDLFKLLKSMENLSQELILRNEAMVFADRKNFSETLRLFLKETNNYYTEYIEDSCNALMGTIMNILCEIFSLDLKNLNCKDFSTLCNIFTNIVKNTNKNRISELVVDFNELKSTANLKINNNINLCGCILYYLDNYGFPIDRLGDIKKKLEEKIKQIPSKKTFISNLKDKKNPSLISEKGNKFPTNTSNKYY